MWKGKAREYVARRAAKEALVDIHSSLPGSPQDPAWLGGHELITEPVAWDGTLLVGRGEFDVSSVSEMRKQLDGAVATGATRILLDLAEVTFIDSLSLATIVAAKRRMGDHARLALVVVHPYVRLIFEAGGLDSVVDVFETRAAAEEHLLA
jgi:anti-anti-sigma factor